MIADGIIKAIKIGDVATVRQIVEKNPKAVDVKDKAGWTAVHVAAGNGRLEVLIYLLQVKPSLINKRTQASLSSPLHISCFKGFASLAEYLLRCGASVNVQDSQGNTPLHAAMYWGHEAIALLLMGNNADYDIKNMAGKTPLQNMVYNKERQLQCYSNMEKMLRVGEKVEVNYKNLGHWYVGVVSFVSLTGFDVDYLDGERDFNVSQRMLKRHGPADRLETVESVDNMLFYAGARVYAQYHGAGPWYPGVISRVRPDGTFDVDFDDGDKDTSVLKRAIRLHDGLLSDNPPSQNCHAAYAPVEELDCEVEMPENLLSVGHSVFVNCDDGEWRDAIVTGVHGSRGLYDLAISNGQRISDVPLSKIDYLIVGASVIAKKDGGEVWSTGVIMRRREDLTYDVDFDDGSNGTRMIRDSILLYNEVSKAKYLS